MANYTVTATYDSITVTLYKSQTQPSSCYGFNYFRMDITGGTWDYDDTTGNYVSITVPANASTNYNVRVRYALDAATYTSGPRYNLDYDTSGTEVYNITTPAAPQADIYLTSFTVTQPSVNTASVRVKFSTNIGFNYYSITDNTTSTELASGTAGGRTSWDQTYSVGSFGTHSIEVYVDAYNVSWDDDTRSVNVYCTISSTVAYDLNGGSGGPTSSSTASASSLSTTGSLSVTLSSTVPTKTGSEFAGWKLGSTVYPAGSSVTLDAARGGVTHTAIAQWGSTTSAYIYATKNGTTKWWPATPYIYSNGWQPATAYVYSNGWQIGKQ